MTAINVVILAAGSSSRLARPYPKALIPLADGRTILGRQLDLIEAAWGGRAAVRVVVGFGAPTVVEAAGPRAAFTYNEEFARTNTARSLWRAFGDVSDEGGILWLNGDVVFDPGVLDAVVDSIGAGTGDEGLVAVARGPVGEEEVKYLLDDAGYVRAISKEVDGSPGEAVGINYVPAGYRQEFTRQLEQCSDEDYFERAIETSVAAGLRFRAVDVTGYGCVEVDFESDVASANEIVRRTTMPLARG